MKNLTCVISHCSFIIIFLSLFCSCEKRNDQDKPDTELGLIEKLHSLGFDTSQGFYQYKDGFIVENDIFLTEAMINEMIADDMVSKGGTKVSHYSSNNRVKGINRTMNVYMSPDFDSFMQDAFDKALTRYNDLHLGLVFERTNIPEAAHIVVNAFYDSETRLLGESAGFPSNGNPAKSIKLNTFFYNGSTRRGDAITVIAHEIGHAIGLRHTDYMDRRFSCGTERDEYGRILNPNEGSGQAGANHLGDTPWDPESNSFMLACNNGTDRPFTEYDKVALYAMYNAVEDEYLSGDWDGDGVDNIAIRRNHRILMDTNFDSGADLFTSYGLGSKYNDQGWDGDAEDQYLVGDWNGDGKDEFGVRRGNQFFLQGASVFSWGNGNEEDQYLVGDWNGDGKDEIGIRRGNQFLLQEAIGFSWGNGNDEDQYLVGDWNGDGKDEIGIRRGNQFLFQGAVGFSWGNGNAEDQYLVGDWNGDGKDEIGIRRNNQLILQTRTPFLYGNAR